MVEAEERDLFPTITIDKTLPCNANCLKNQWEPYMYKWQRSGAVDGSAAWQIRKTDSLYCKVKGSNVSVQVIPCPQLSLAQVPCDYPKIRE